MGNVAIAAVCSVNAHCSSPFHEACACRFRLRFCSRRSRASRFLPIDRHVPVNGAVDRSRGAHYCATRATVSWEACRSGLFILFLVVILALALASAAAAQQRGAVGGAQQCCVAAVLGRAAVFRRT